MAARHIPAALLLVVLAASMAVPSSALNILLTNDDGWSFPAIQTMKTVLETKFGHNVTIVASQTDMSGKGGSSTTRGSVNITRFGSQVYGVAGTPADSVRAGVGILFAGSPPDMVVSGSNLGQNLGITGSFLSGTVNAALAGMFLGIPSIAVSTGINLAEAAQGFPTTFAEFNLSAAFVGRTIARLEKYKGDGPLLPSGVMLNINVPVPYSSIKGVRTTVFGPPNSGDVGVRWSDPSGAILSTGTGLATLATTFSTPGNVLSTDTGAFFNGWISITAVNAQGATNGGFLRSKAIPSSRVDGKVW